MQSARITLRSQTRKALEKMGHHFETFHKGVGCKSCRNTGFRGRSGVHELLVINDEMRDAIASDCSLGHLKALAQKAGMLSLADDGFQKVKEGITTVEEIFHVAGETRSDADSMARTSEEGAGS